MTTTVKGKIINIRYFTGKDGHILPLLTVRCENKEDEIVRLPNLKVLQTLDLSIGTSLSIEFEGELSTNITEIKAVDDGVIPMYPRKCPSCNELLNKLENEVLCINPYCSAKPRSHIYRMIMRINPLLQMEANEAYLDKYLVGESCMNITNLGDFHSAFYYNHVKDTKPVLDRWVGLHGNILGNQLFDLDRDIFNRLKRCEHNKRMFWAVANLPKFNLEDEKAISEIDPTLFIKNDNLDTYQVNEKQKEILQTNKDFLHKLHDFFCELGEVQWI